MKKNFEMKILRAFLASEKSEVTQHQHYAANWMMGCVRRPIKPKGANERVVAVLWCAKRNAECMCVWWLVIDQLQPATSLALESSIRSSPAGWLREP
jgi:hypothetical protein